MSYVFVVHFEAKIKGSMVQLVFIFGYVDGYFFTNSLYGLSNIVMVLFLDVSVREVVVP